MRGRWIDPICDRNFFVLFSPVDLLRSRRRRLFYFQRSRVPRVFKQFAVLFRMLALDSLETDTRNARSLVHGLTGLFANDYYTADP